MKKICICKKIETIQASPLCPTHGMIPVSPSSSQCTCIEGDDKNDYYCQHCSERIGVKSSSQGEWEEEVYSFCSNTEIANALVRYIKSFLSIIEARTRRECAEVSGKAIDDYFKGLIHIPSPQDTKEKLKGVLAKAIEERK